MAKGLEGLVSGLQRAVLGKSTYSEAKRAGPELWPSCSRLSTQDKAGQITPSPCASLFLAIKWGNGTNLIGPL